MVIKFKLHIFRSCQTKHSSTPPENLSPAIRDSPRTNSSPLLKQTPHRSSFKTHIFSVFRNGSFRNQSAAEDLPTHVIGKLFDVVSTRSNNSNSDIADNVVCDKKNLNNRKPETNKPNNVTISSARYSTGYTMDNDVKEHENRPEIHRYPCKSFSDVGIRTRHNGIGGGQVSPEWGSPARLLVFKKLMPCKVEGKVKESFAVVKRSEKPFEDFKKSMMEMIVENQIYEETDLKQLLQCFLSLNSWYHHGVIMEAFSEIWKTMFLN